VEEAKRKRILKIVCLGMAVVILCPVLVHFGRVWIPRIWGDLRFVNYFVAFIPTILSILFAFVIDKELERRMKIMWRIGIVACGFLYSAALWHQQSLTDKSNLAIQTTIVHDAVTQANQHSDEKFAGVKKDVGDLGTQVSGLSKSLDTRTDALGKALDNATGTINTNLGKVGRPDPPVPAKLQLYLWYVATTT
jgi:hypothetical protein